MTSGAPANLNHAHLPTLRTSRGIEAAYRPLVTRLTQRLTMQSGVAPPCSGLSAKGGVSGVVISMTLLLGLTTYRERWSPWFSSQNDAPAAARRARHDSHSAAESTDTA